MEKSISQLVRTSIFFHFPPLLFGDPFLNLFRFRNFARDFYNSVHNEGGGEENSIIGNGFNILDFNYLGINSELFDRLFSSLRKLVAFGSPHT